MIHITRTIGIDGHDDDANHEPEDLDDQSDSEKTGKRLSDNDVETNQNASTFSDPQGEDTEMGELSTGHLFSAFDKPSNLPTRRTRKCRQQHDQASEDADACGYFEHCGQPVSSDMVECSAAECRVMVGCITVVIDMFSN